MVYVDSSRCAGCGLCTAACPVGAIRLVDGTAVVAQEQCRGCEACVEACPRGAIVSVSEATLPAPAPPQGISMRTTPSPPQTITTRPAWVNAIVAALDIAPRVLTTLLDIWERVPRHTTDAPTAATRRAPAVPYTPPPGISYGGRRRRRTRRRGRW